jgi:glutathione peroxidase
MIELGLVKWYNDAKRYGFIKADSDGESILAQSHSIVEEPKTLREFQRVTFERFVTDNGLEARTINIAMNPDLSIYEHEVISLKKQRLHLSSFVGHVLLVVNTASRCGLTPQYEGLEKLFQTYKDKKFTILAFPTNNFAGQEPNTNAEILDFCETNYNVSFYVMEKSNIVEQDSSSPAQFAETAPREINSFYKDLATRTNVLPQWNFHKYLINRTGSIIKSFDHLTQPDNDVLINAIEEFLDSNI